MERGFKKDKDYVVYFCQKNADIKDVVYPAVFIHPPGNWDDFTYKTTCSYQVFQEKEKLLYEDDLRLGFFPRGNNDELLDDPFSTSQQLLITEDKTTQFFTLQGGMESYRRIVSEIGIGKAVSVLNSMNDLVSVAQLSSAPVWLSKVEDTEVFKLAFMRLGTHFFAYHNAGSILKGLEEESIEGISTDYKLSYKLDSFKNNHEVEFSFDLQSLLPKRISVLIGENGLGKSQALTNIVDSLVDGDNMLSQGNGERLRINRLIAIATPGETDNTFPDEKDSSQVDYKRLVTGRDSNSNKSRGFGEMCVQLVRAGEDGLDIKGKSRWGLFLKFMKNLSDYESICLQTSDSKSFSFLIDLGRRSEMMSLQVFSKVANDKQPVRYIDEKIYPLSSGELALLKFAVQACLNIENASLILLDEPETHLHPSYVSEFIFLLDYLLKETGSLAIIATHSPYLVREMPRSQVQVFKRAEGESISIGQPRLKTFGADIDSISHFVFEDDVMNRLGEKLIEELKDKTSLDNVMNELKEDLPVEMIMYINHRLGVLD